MFPLVDTAGSRSEKWCEDESVGRLTSARSSEIKLRFCLDKVAGIILVTLRLFLELRNEEEG